MIQSAGSSHPDRVRMLVLETDETFEETGERKGTFGQIFHDLFVCEDCLLPRLPQYQLGLSRDSYKFHAR